MSLVPSDDRPFFSDLAALMRSEAFRRFYTAHMATNLDLRTSLVYVELWTTIEEMYEKRTGGKQISDESIEMVLRETFRRKEYRKPLVALVQSYLDNGITRQALDGRVRALFQQHLLALPEAGGGQSKKI